MKTAETAGTDPHLYRWASLVPSQLSLPPIDVARGLLRIAGTMQYVVVGLLVLPLSPGRLHDPNALMRTVGLGVVAAILSPLIFRALQSPPGSLGAAMTHSTLRVVQAAAAVLIAFVIIGACRSLTFGMGPSPAPLTCWALFSAATAALMQFVPPPKDHAIIVGDRGSAASLTRKLLHLPAPHGVQVVATLDANDDDWLQRLDLLVSTGAATRVIAPMGSGRALLRTLCLRLADTSARIQVALTNDLAAMIPSGVCSVHYPSSVPMIDLLPPPMAGWRRLTKRIFDLVCVLLFMPLLLPLCTLIAILIWLESPGSPLFRQWRFGESSKPVLIYKFRTMRVEQGDSTGAIHTLPRDPRVTRIGRILRRLSLDELPQLLNVLRGEMSLVGPRPHATHMQIEGIYYFEAVDAYRVRHRTLPGITGWAQVNGSRGAVDTMEKAQRRVGLDLWYLANWSPVLDIWILLRTVFGGFATLRAD